MGWLIPRLLATVLVVLAGALVGMALGAVSHWPAVGALLGAAVGALLHAFFDALRAHRFMDWLRRQHEGAAPRDAGFWGEVGYRVERSVRLLERRVDSEHARLDQFLSAIEASPNGVMLLDANDQIEWCNSVAADHFGLDPQRDRRQRVTNLVRAPVFVAYLQSGAYDDAVSFAGPGSRGTISVLIRTYGEGMKLVLSQDITERERNDAMRRDFVANVSHEIRTPLTVLAGFIETMGNLPLTEVERRRVLELMSQQTTRMQTLVGDLLTLAQLEGSPRPPADRWVAVQRLFAQVQVDARALSAARHTLNFNGGETAQIAGAEAELLSAIANLVNNAVRYTPSGGNVDVSWTQRGDGAGELRVRDSGIGIAREHLPRLTERFYRVDGSRSRDTGGTGLGLSIVKHVAQRHGGELEVTSEPGKGSSFTLVFPAPRVRSSEPATQPQQVDESIDRIGTA
ncbi:phosphate regulon sensor histidine kinase PhoR [Piscinibacter sp.]|jgi:two-component system phosphate regulon sensor histidine kinase PhoR|uniref:phosphate regulon sensor histidine kinase PhoR n=1 Tax=Piscinibacter sp. TaxID=1903157 RepID=UPI00355952BB